MRRLLAPPVTARQELVATALRRGISPLKIALAMDVSRQRITQVIEKYERRRGTIVRSRFCNPKPNKMHFKCICGWNDWRTKKFLKKGTKKGARIFCSKTCYGKYQRIFAEEDIKKAISLRLSGLSWKAVVGAVDSPNYQTLQGSIWQYLHETGALTIENVEHIWCPAGGVYGSYLNLINKTGLTPFGYKFDEGAVKMSRRRIGEYAASVRWGKRKGSEVEIKEILK